MVLWNSDLFWDAQGSRIIPGMGRPSRFRQKSRHRDCPGDWYLYNSTAECRHTIEAGTNPACGCHFPEGNSAHSRWSSAAIPPDWGLPSPVYPEGIAAFASLNWSERLESLRDTVASVSETCGVAALDHRLWAVTPPGNAVKDSREAFPKVLPPLPHIRFGFRSGLHCGEEGRGEGAGASGVAPSPQPWPGETGFWRLSSL